MVPRFRSRSNFRLRPINRIKHVFDQQVAAVPGTHSKSQLIVAVDNPSLANVSEVETGCTVNGIYLHIEVSRTGTTSDVLPNVYMIVYKNPGGNIADIVANAVGADDDKRYVIHQEMVMLQGTNAGNPRTLFNGVIVLPRGYRRFGPNDLLTLRILSPGVNISICIQAHWKEFR